VKSEVPPEPVIDNLCQSNEVETFKTKRLYKGYLSALEDVK
jgi:hypothetical protein